MKRFLKTFLLALILLPALVFSACGKKGDEDSKTDLSSSNIVLEFDTYEYTGDAIEPNVTVIINNKTVSDDNYTIKYSDNINIEKGTVKVTANDDSEIIKGSATKDFSIVEHIEEVSDYNELINAIRANFKNIRLTNNIEKQTRVNRNEVYIFTGSTDNRAIPMDIDITLDLNGYIIENPIYIDDCSISEAFSINATIENGTILVVEEIDTSSIDYGIKIVGNENLNLTLSDLIVHAPKNAVTTSREYSKSTIKATNCEFSATGEDSPIGANLLSDHNYNFSDCTFSGDAAYLFSAGVHVLDNCNFIAVGKQGSSLSSAIILVSTTSLEPVSSKISITINGGTIESHNGYAAEEQRVGEHEYVPEIEITLSGVKITCMDGTSAETAFKLTAGLTASNCTYQTYTPKNE